MTAASFYYFGAALLFAPLLAGLINRTKAFFAGRTGQSVFQQYRDIFKLLRKSAVYSVTTTEVFRIAPAAVTACMLFAAMLMPFADAPALLTFDGDIIVFAYLLATARFFTMTAALDTGSSFEGMGASREAWISALAEPAFFIAAAALVKMSGALSLTGVFSGLHVEDWLTNTPSVFMTAAAVFIILLAENARIPFDDPNTHLELTMVHEVMVLDNSGPDLGLITYSASLKLWIFCAFLVQIMIPAAALTSPFEAATVFTAAMAATAILVGTVESCMARLRLTRIPQLLIGAIAMAAVAFIMAA